MPVKMQKNGTQKFNEVSFEDKDVANESFQKIDKKKILDILHLILLKGCLNKIMKILNTRFHEGRFKSSKDFFRACKLQNLDLSKIIVCEGFYENSLNDEMRKKIISQKQL